jgi:hypothetical protein
LAAFYAGYGEQQVLEIILGLSKVISNYTNHIANMWMELSKFAWKNNQNGSQTAI